MMQMSMRVSDSSWTNPRDNFESVPKSLSPDQRFAAERAFSSVLVNTVCEAVGDVLGSNVLEILSLKGLLDASNNLKVFDSILRSLFGIGDAVLERIVVTALKW